MFNDVIDKIGNILEKNKTYFIQNGNVKSVNTKYPNVHQEIEISLSSLSEVEISEECIGLDILKFNLIELSIVPSLVDCRKLLGM